MSEYIEVGQPLQFTDPNTPTRVGEIVENVSDIYNIPSPRLGMQVFVKSEKKSFVITSLKSKVIGGVDVPEAAVEAFEHVGAKSITWNNDTDPSNMNDFVVAGVYDIKGERTRVNDNLPILNIGGGHSFNARLTVLDSSISGNGKDDDKCITQVLSFSNRLGQGEVYIRTGKGSSLDNLIWEKWSTLQRNVNVEEVSALDNLIDNGIYSGVLNTTGETFVLVVINNYALASKFGVPKSISQFKYSVSPYGVISFGKRVKVGDRDFSRWDIINYDEISSMINTAVEDMTEYTQMAISTAIADLVGTTPDTLDTLQEIAEWVLNHQDLYGTLKAIAEENTKKINDEIARAEQAEHVINDKLDEEIERSASADSELLSMIDAEQRRAEQVEEELNVKINDEKERAEKHLADEIEKIKDGDTIAGQAMEIHSRNGKTVEASFLARTTAGSGTIGDGVASLKSVGGNIVKNLVDGGCKNARLSNTLKLVNNNGIVTATATEGGVSYYQIYYESISVVANHSYYTMVILNNHGFETKISTTRNVQIVPKKENKWQFVSGIHQSTVESAVDRYNCRAYIRIESSETLPTIEIGNWLVIDLTEMYGVGDEPDQATCDRLFGTMDALPQGLTIANPTEFKSIGFNQFNPDNVLEGKAITNNAIESGDKKIAVIPCLPCKVGTGDNNGYCIHGDFGEDINVYLTPLNPMEVDGELYMHKLTKDATTDTYVPLIKGYMLVEVPTTANLCAHFLWSEDKCKRDTYEPYFESRVELPTIPQMSEWGLAGIQSSGTLVCDEIDFERGVYIKRLTKRKLNDVRWTYYSADDIHPYGFFVASISGIKLSKVRNVFPSAKYTTGASFIVDKTVFGNVANNGNAIYIVDSECNNREALNANLADVDFYLEINPEEYPLQKVDNNYISSDYGVEQFDGVVPCNTNNLYYMRSLAGETRNFLDRLMAGLGTSDATVVADRILAVVNPAVEPANVEPETPIEE